MAGIDQQYNKEYGKALSEYSLYSAGQDQSINSIIGVVTSKLGEQLREPLRDLALAVQSLTGVGNRGVQSAISTLGGIQNYGVPGIMPGGGSGMIGGQTIAALHAAQAVQNQLLSQYTNPATGMSSSRSYGLNQAEMGKAVGWLMSSGMQYAGGPDMFRTTRVDDAYRHAQLLKGKEIYNQTGNRSLYDQARELQTGQTHTTMTRQGEETLTKFVDDAAATLGSIKRVMGSKALEDLDDTMQKLFGGDMSKFGLRASRMRMAEIEASASYYGGKEAAAAAYGASASVVGSGSSIVDAHAAAAVERAARAARRGSMKDVGVGYATGADVNPESHAEAAGRRGEATGGVIQDETEFLLLERSLKAKGSISETEKARLDELYRARNAAKTPEELNVARANAYAFSQEVMPGYTLQDFGGKAQALKDLGPQGAARLAAQAAAMQQAQSQAAVQKYFQQSPAYSAAMGVSAADAGVLGLGISNMDPLMRQQLGDAVSQGKLDEFRKTHAGIDETLGVDSRQFWGLLQSGKIGKEGIERYGAATRELPELQRLGFTRKSQMQEQGEEDYNSYVKANYSGSQAPQEFMDELLRGLTGNREWTNVEKLNEVLSRDPSKVSRFSTNKDRIAGTDKNLEVLNSLSPDELRTLTSMGMPSDPAAIKKWMETGAGSQAIGQVLSASGRAGAFNQGEFVFTSAEEGHAASERLSKKALEKSAPISGAPAPKGDETAAMYEANLKKYISGRFGKGAEEDLINNALAGGSDLDKAFKSDLLSQEQKDMIGKKIVAQGDELNSQIAKYDKMAQEGGGQENGKAISKEEAEGRMKELSSKRAQLEQLGDKYLSNAGQSINSKGTVNISAPQVIIQTKETKSS